MEQTSHTLPEPANRQEVWGVISQRVEKFRDGLGLPVEDGIKETLIAINALGFTTRQSCAGHLERAQAAPWVDIEVVGGDELERAAEEAFAVAEKAEGEGSPEEELDQLYEEAHSLRKEAVKPMLEEARRMVGYLGGFYENYNPPYDVRLTITPFGRVCRLESAGAFLQDVNDHKTRQQKLEKYQEEMKAFTAFLRGRFFSE